MIVVDSQLGQEVEISTTLLPIIVTPTQFYKPHLLIERTNIELEPTIQSCKNWLIDDIM